MFFFFVLFHFLQSNENEIENFKSIKNSTKHFLPSLPKCFFLKAFTKNIAK